MSSIENNDYYSFMKKIFDEIDEVILKSHERDNSQNIPNVEDVTHDQKDKPIVNILDVTADDELLLCIADGVVKNKKVENDNICSVVDLPSQETMISDLSDDESSPKKLKQFTFTDSDLPDSEEIEEFLKAYPRPQVTYFPWFESESQSYSDEESNWLSHRRRKKMKPVTIKITIEKLPERFMTRQRKPNIYLVTKKDCYRVLQSTYLKNHEDQTDEEIIRENIKRLKTSNTNNISESKDTKSKSFAKNNITHDIISVKTTIRRTRYMKNKGDGINNKNKSISSGYYKNDYKRKRALKKEISILLTVKGRRSKRNQKTKEKDENTMKAPVSVPKSEDKNNKNKNISPGNYKNDFIRKRALKKERSTLPAVEGRRSKRNQKTKEKDEDTMKAPVSVPKSEDKNNENKNISSGNDKNDFIRKRALKKERSKLPAVEGRRSKRNQKTKVKDVDTMKAPVSVPKKRVHEQRTVYNISSSSSESPKGLKRSLVVDIDVLFPKRTRSHNNKVTNAPTSVRLTEKIRGLEPDKRVRNAPARRGRKAA